ncbi:two-component system OmpR family response regulator [Paenibacillus sp. V4I3]|uniref:response regulator transcription factor n=1 Tax=unclassified Paenibacillus TaxID=185978 RepID=UPI0027829462|nr:MULTISPECIES: response regulator transcription factor [unclassified Paenibacillus]MDQ0874161.1 two-component system OmpR family response regulator [Paenibacillus sp. V4I3]MDQ0889962.1 two-component system OmpR family response regulator [Paenibacillus sp. V4I9]
MTRIMVVDDDADIRELIRVYLAGEGLTVMQASNGQEALSMLETTPADLVVLDVMMPLMDGWELCRELRAQYADLPLLMVTAKSESVHKVKGFQLGTDDYLVKPFDPVELVMRVKALLKRYRINASQTITLGNVIIDRTAFEVRLQDQRLALPLKEFELLYKLASYPAQIFTRTQLIEQIWGMDYEGDDRTVDVHVKRLRERFESLTEEFRITTIRGLGYRLEVKP